VLYPYFNERSVEKFADIIFAFLTDYDITTAEINSYENPAFCLNGNLTISIFSHF